MEHISAASHSHCNLLGPPNIPTDAGDFGSQKDFGRLQKGARFRRLALFKFDLSGITPIKAAWLIPRDTARQIQADTISPYDGARAIGNLANDFQPLFPAMEIFIGLWSE